MKNALCTYKKHREQKSYAGVTLLEILIAVGILALSISAIMQIFPMGFSASARASYTAIAYELANQKMEEIRASYIFGGDPNPKLACDDPETFKYFGYRGMNGNVPKTGEHPLSLIYGEQYNYIHPNQTSSADDTFRAFRSSDGANVESRYFYRVEMIPQVDVVKKSGNYIYLIPSFSSETNPTYNFLKYNPYFRHGFCDAYRVKITVRGPVRKREHAQDANWKYYKKAAVEANLTTIIANREFGIGYLAYDVICRVGIKTYSSLKGTEVMFKYNQYDSRSIYVTGPNLKRFYPENFAVIRPESLTMNERWDTGPAIAFPCNSATRPTSGPDAYYAARRGGTNHKYNYVETWDLLTGTKVSEPISGHIIDFDRFHNRQKREAVSWALQNCRVSGTDDSYTSEGFNNSSWNDVEWNSAYDTSNPKIAKLNPKNNINSTLCDYSGNAFVPGGLNLLGQDNIMLICKRKGKDNKDYYFAESNKLIFVAPPQTKAEIVNQYGSAWRNYNHTAYWRFDLLNNVYGRDSDCSTRRTKYGAQPLVDEVWGMPNSDKGYPHDGDFDLLTYDEDNISPKRNVEIEMPDLGTIWGSSGRTWGIIAQDVHVFRTNSNYYSAVYGYPKASFNDDGTLKSGTVVRFLMQMPTRE